MKASIRATAISAAASAVVVSILSIHLEEREQKET